MTKISPSEITPEHIFLSRRKLMMGAGTLAVGAVALAACSSMEAPSASEAAPEGIAAPSTVISDLPAALAHADIYASQATDELGDALNPYEHITNYNNYYEFSVEKEAVAPLSKDFTILPWSVEITGMVNKPQTIAYEDMLQNFAQEERIYRLRCVEGWSMVIPWVGFPVGDLLNLVEPTAEAKFVQFTTVVRPEEMPGQNGRSFIEYPYIEGLRLDEAMNPLAIFATGMYGKPLVPANGAPFRLIVPWKYGFKSGKSIVKIELTDTMPVSTWMKAAPNEYGFYANVNPAVSHPRWSQATERRIGESGRRDTLPFNGYAEEVAYLYEGMDLQENF